MQHPAVVREIDRIAEHAIAPQTFPWFPGAGRDSKEEGVPAPDRLTIDKLAAKFSRGALRLFGVSSGWS